MSRTNVPTALPVVRWDTIPTRAACQECGEQGFISVPDSDDRNNPYLKQCPVCNGVARDMIPWTELFRAGTHFIPMFYEDDYEEEDGY